MKIQLTVSFIVRPVCKLKAGSKIQHYFICIRIQVPGNRTDMNFDSLGKKGNIRIQEVGSEEPKSVSGESSGNETKRNTSCRRWHGVFRICNLRCIPIIFVKISYVVTKNAVERKRTNDMAVLRLDDNSSSAYEFWTIKYQPC